MRTSNVLQLLSGLKKIQSKLIIIVSIILIISSTLYSSIIFKFLGNELFKIKCLSHYVFFLIQNKLYTNVYFTYQLAFLLGK
ncbi:hypothetical protein DVW12_15565 [Clostridium botulinum]|nr:hypothetical protein [Clostridium botulinum]